MGRRIMIMISMLLTNNNCMNTNARTYSTDRDIVAAGSVIEALVGVVASFFK